MKILQVSRFYYPPIGGVQKVVRQIAEGLNHKDGFEVEVLCCQPKGRGRVEKINKIKVHRAQTIGMIWGLPISFVFLKLFKKLSEGADLIDFHHPFPLGDLAIFLFKPRVRLIVHYHSDIVKQNIFSFLLKPLFFNTLKKAERIMVSSPNLLKNSRSLKRFREKCQVAPFGVDLKKFKPESKKEVKKINEKYGKFVLFVGRLVYYKGLNYLIGAMKNVEANLVIIGQGPLRHQLGIIARRLGVKNRIFFLSGVSDEELVNFYHACSLLVLPSIFKSEAFGIVLIEAMACGKPVISTELGTGTSSINQNGLTGIVVLPRNKEALASAINKLLEDKRLAEKFGKNSLQRVSREFALEEMLETVGKIYNIII